MRAQELGAITNPQERNLASIIDGIQAAIAILMRGIRHIAWTPYDNSYARFKLRQVNLGYYVQLLLQRVKL
jgi:hypothetical protein